MTSTEIGTGSRPQDCSANAARPNDTRLAALLESKPPADDVPLETWWHLAESLEHSIPVRRAREGVELLDASALQRHTHQARWAAQAALAHLGPGASSRRTEHTGDANVRLTIRELARLVVTARPTTRETLRGAVLDHLDALGSAL